MELYLPVNIAYFEEHLRTTAYRVLRYTNSSIIK